MISLKDYLRSTVGQKALVGLTGLGVAGFTLIHMSGNMLILMGPEPYNKYSHALISNPLIYFAEAGLLAIFLFHVAIATRLFFLNRGRRGVAYATSVTGSDKGTTLAARSMILTGALVFVFLVLHLISFKFGAEYTATYQGIEMRDLHKLVVEKFKEPLFVGWYVFSMVVLWVHMSHGVAAAFQSLGAASSLNRCLRKAALGITTLIVLGFLSQPLYVFFGCGGF